MVIYNFFFPNWLQPPHVGSMMMPTMMYTQPVMRPPNPFGPNPGAQVFKDGLFLD